MLSKNNFQERLRKMEQKKERFSIRKFSVGAASVLIGFTIFGMQHGESVKADTVVSTDSKTGNADQTTDTGSGSSDSMVEESESVKAQTVAVADQAKVKVPTVEKSSAKLVDANADNEKTGADRDASVSEQVNDNSGASINKEETRKNSTSKDISANRNKVADDSNKNNLKEKNAENQKNDADIQIPQITLEQVKQKYADFEANAASMTSDERKKAANDLKLEMAKLSIADQIKLATINSISSENGSSNRQASEFNPSYKDIEMWPGETKSQDIDWGKDSSGNPISTPAGVTFKRWGTTPSWINVDENTGKLTYNPKLSDGWGDNNVTVHATFADGSTKDIKSKVNLKYIQDDISTTINDVELHKTSDSSMNLAAIAKAVSIDTDLSYYIDSIKQDKHPVDHFVAQEDSSGNIIYVADQNSKHPGLTISGVKVSWDGDKPTTNSFDTTAPEDAPRQESGNQMHYPKYSVSVDLSNAKLSKDGIETDDLGLTEEFEDIKDNPHTNYLEVHYAGAIGKQNIKVKLGDAVPTDKAALENYMSQNDLEVSAEEGYEKLNNWKVKDVSWAPNGKPGKDGKFDKDHLNGTVRFTFDDGNNNSSYLDVPVSFLATQTYTYGSWVMVQDPEKPKTYLYQKWHYKQVSYTDENNIPSAKLDDVKLPNVASYYIPKVISLKGAPAATIVKKEDGSYYLQFPTVNSTRKENDYYVKYTDSREYVQEHLDVYGPNNFTDSSDPHTAEGGYWGTVSRTEVKMGDDGKYPITDVPTKNINDLVKKKIFTNDKTGAKNQTLPEEWAKQGYIPIITAVAVSGSHNHSNSESEMLNKLTNYIKSYPMCTTLPDFKAEVPMDVHFVVHYVKPIDYTPAQKDDDGSYIDDDMNYDSIRYIYVHGAKDPSSAATIEQDIHFSRNVNGHAGYVGANGKKIWNPWKLDPDSQTEWPEYGIPQITGYESRLDTRDDQDSLPTKDELKKFSKATKVDRIEIGNVSDWASQDTPLVVDEDGNYPDGYYSPDDVNIYYTAKNQSTTVTYVDDKGNEIKMPDGSAISGSHYTLNGKTGETVDTNIQANVPKNWKLVGDKVTSQITFGANGHDPIKVQVEHKTQQISWSEDNPDSYKEVKQTVYVTKPGETTPTKISETILKFVRNGVKDLVSNNINWGEWTPSIDPETDQPQINFKKVDVTYPGYTAKSEQVDISTEGDKQYVPESEKTTAGSSDQIIYVTYTANEHHAKVIFVDKEGNEVKNTDGSSTSYTVTGKTKETIDLKVPDHVPTGWKISGKSYTGSLTLGFSDPADTKITVEHKKTAVNADKNNWDTYRTITQNIYVADPATNKLPEKAIRTITLNFQRSGTKDEVTGDIKWNAWTPDKFEDGSEANYFPQYEVTEPGYTAVSTDGTVTKTEDGKFIVSASDKVDPDKLTKKNNIRNIHVTYTTDALKQRINFVDNGDKTTVVGKQDIPGTVGKVVTITQDGSNNTTKLNVPENWKVVGDAPTSITFGSKDGDPMTVYVEHKTETIDGRNDQKNTDVYRKVTRKIVMNVPGATTPGTETETLEFYRIKTHDDVTGEDSYSDWKSNVTGDKSTFDEFNVSKTNNGKTIAAGYIPSSTDVTLTEKNGDMYVPSQSGLKSNGTPVDNYTVILTYTANDQSTIVTYVDDKGNEIKNPDGSAIKDSHYTVSGKTGETVDTDIETKIPENWQLVGGQTISSQITFDANGHDPIKVQVEHKTEKVQPEENNKDSYRKITQTIYETLPGQTEPQMVRQSYVVYTRTGTKDLVTNEITWDDWIPAIDKDTHQPVTNFDEFEVTYPGYTAKSKQVNITTKDGKQYVPASDKITEDSDDQTIYVTYDANVDHHNTTGDGDTPKPKPQPQTSNSSQPTKTQPSEPKQEPKKKPAKPKKPSKPVKPAKKKVSKHHAESGNAKKHKTFSSSSKSRQNRYNRNVGAHAQTLNGQNRRSSETAGVHAQGLGQNNDSRPLGAHEAGSAENGLSRGKFNGVNADKKTLPQTSEKHDKAELIGMTVASLALLLGFAGVKKKHKHN